jgi:hypothetical protein
LSARDNSSHCHVASFRISGRHLFPCEDVRKMEQELDVSFIDSETRKNIRNNQLQKSHLRSGSSYKNKCLGETTI